MKEKKIKTIEDNPLIKNILQQPYLTIIALAFAVYFQTLFFDYIQLDDDYFHNENPDTIEKVASFKHAILSGYMLSSYYRPMVNLSFALESNIDGGTNFLHHLTNIIIHSITACLIFVLFNRLKYKRIISLLAAIIFTVHPILTNATVWIVGRNDLLVGMFTILSFIFFLRYIEKNKLIYLVLHAVSFLFAAMSKELALIIPIIMFAYWFLFAKDKINRPGKITLIFIWIVPIISFPLIKSYLNIGMMDYYFSLSNIFITYKTVPETIAKIIFPFKINALPSYTALTTLIGNLLIITTIILFYKKKKEINLKKILFGFIWYIVPIFPSMFIHLNNIHKEDHLYCRVYLPIIGIFIIITELLPDKAWDLTNKYILALIISIITLFSILTIYESRFYKDPITFWESAVERNPEKGTMLRRLGFAYGQYGKDYKKGIEYAKKALEFDSTDAVAYLDLGFYYSVTGKIYESIKMTKTAVTVNPKLHEAYQDLFMNYYKIKQFDSAAKYAYIFINTGGNVDPEVLRFLEQYRK